MSDLLGQGSLESSIILSLIFSNSFFLFNRFDVSSGIRASKLLEVVKVTLGNRHVIQLWCQSLRSSFISSLRISPFLRMGFGIANFLVFVYLIW